MLLWQLWGWNSLEDWKTCRIFFVFLENIWLNNKYTKKIHQPPPFAVSYNLRMLPKKYDTIEKSLWKILDESVRNLAETQKLSLF